MSDDKSNFAGFLDGYKAQNIASSSTSLSFHWEEMRIKLIDLIKSIHGKSESIQIQRYYQKLINVLSNISNDHAIEKALKFAESLNTLFQESTIDRDIIVNDKEFRRVVFHFFEIAEIVGDKRVVDIAVEFGELFQLREM